MHKIRISYDINVPSEGVTLYSSSPQFGPKVVLISGGDGASSVAEALKNYTHNSKHIVTMYDDGGSSRVIRDAFNMPPPGDLRNVLMHMTDPSARGGSKIAEVFKHRLSKTEYEPKHLQDELDSFILLSHPKLLLVERGLGNIISLYLNHFNKEKPNNFDLRGASIGNLVMTGCYLLHGYDFENAVYLISSLAKVKGTAIPVTLGNYYLGAELADGTKVYGQANVTRQNDRYDSPIRRLFFVKNRQAGANELRVEANERAVSALREADLIVYSIGSFYTSILCTLLTHGILDAIKQSNAPKIFLANAVADDETKGLSLSHMLTAFNHCCQSIGDATRVLAD